MFKKELPIITMGLSIVAAILVLSWAVFIKSGSVIPIQSPVVSDEEIVSDGIEDNRMEDDDVLADDISDWKTYRNEEYGFEIKYPEDWGVSIGESKPWHKGALGVVYITGDTKDPFYAPIAITTLGNKKRLPIKKWYQEYYPKGDGSRLQEVKFNEVNGMRILSLWLDGLDGFYFSNEDRIYSVSIMDLQENAENQIMMNEKLLSTFKFINF